MAIGRTPILAAAAVPLTIAAFSMMPRTRSATSADRGSSIAIEAVTCDPEPTDASECHRDFPTGCTDSDNPSYDAYLNFLKNLTEPFPAANDPKVLSKSDYLGLNGSTPTDLASRNHEDFKSELSSLGEGQTRAVIGYLYYAKPTGAETSNCKLTGTEDVDFHIGIGFDKKTNLGAPHKPSLALQQASVIIEMTPHTRKDTWTDAALQAARGKAVKAVGQLMIDNDHNNPSQNCGAQGADKGKCWRFSTWELHPVTQFLVCAKASCDENSPVSDWEDLQEPGAPAAAEGANSASTAASKPKK